MQYRISKIDKDFDGIVFNENNQAIKVPYTLQGELVDIKSIDKTNNIAVATNFEIIESSSNRVIPSCKYFSKCGGCKAQHLKKADYLNQKVANLKHLLLINNIDYKKEIEVIHHVGDKTGHRRRAILSVNGNILGFKAYRSNKVIDIDFCEISTSKINLSIKYLRDIIKQHNSKFKITDIIISDVNDSIDILIKAKSKIDINVINSFQVFFQQEYIKKITWNNEPLIIKEEININYGDYKVPFSSGGFLQAEKFGEDAFISFVLSKLGESKKVLDLFCGFGSYAFSLINSTCVEAIACFDISLDSINAINKYKSSRLQAFSRDLFKNPIKVADINKFDSIVINPPRVGSLQQIEEIAKSDIKKVVMIYCSAESAIRDSIVLLKNSNLRMSDIKVVDQFIYSPHVEVLICFDKI